MPERPNFLVIMTEQHRADCLGIEGHPCLMTPTMDKIGARGVRFTKAYVTCPTCIAARRSFLSGQHPATHGMVGYKDGIEWDAPATLPGELSKAGYQTEWVGRSIHQHPPRKRYGFEHMTPHEDYREWLKQNEPPGTGGMFGHGIKNNDWTARPWHTDEGLHHTNWTVNQALDFLEKHDPSCPFFLCVSFLAAHPPLTPPAFYFERYLRADIPPPVIGDWATPPPDDGVGVGPATQSVHLTGEALRACRAGYYGLINHVDDQLNRILNPVRALTSMTDRDTVVLFVSDHGEMLGDHYRFHKIMPYESAARIPFMIWGPERLGLPSGRVCDQPVCLEDVMPTVLELAGVSCPDSVEGRSVLPLLRGETTDWRPYLHIEHAPKHQSLTDGKQKFIWHVQDGREQFFDLTQDPRECHDLIDDPAWQARIATWRTRLIQELEGRPEGFTDGEKLIAGRPCSAVLER